jgi:hypothetical protein
MAIVRSTARVTRDVEEAEATETVPISEVIVTSKNPNPRFGTLTS